VKRLLPYLAYAFVVGMSAFGHWRIAVDAQHDDAARCVTAWEVRQDIRSAIAGAATVPVEALIAVVPDADPAQVTAYRDEATRRIGEATGEIADPDCDLEAARERLR
jgi:hypothetical protein